MNDNEIEKEIKDKNLTAPRVTKDIIDDLMSGIDYQSWHVAGTTTTIVAAVMADGFVVAVGKSATVSRDNFDKAIGYNIARDNAENLARDKLWELKGWELKQALNANNPTQ